MKTLELGLSPDAVHDWDVWCGVRELIQNWQDNDEEKCWIVNKGEINEL